MAANDSLRFLLLDIACLQLAWFSAALLHDQATLIVAIVLLIRLWASKNLSVEIFAVLRVALFGLVLETAMVISGFIQYNSVHIIPYWLVMLWLIFAFTTRHSLRWLARQPWFIQAGSGALAGSLSYHGAQSLGVLEITTNSFLSVLTLSLLWACSLPFIMRKLSFRGIEKHEYV